MRSVAIAIAALAAAIGAQPALTSWAATRESSRIGASCWAEDATAGVADIVKQGVLKHMLEAMRKEDPKTKMTAAELAKTLKVNVGKPLVEEVSRDSGSAKCGVQLGVQFGDGTADQVIEYQVYRQAAGHTPLIRTLQLDALGESLLQSMIATAN